jgi:pimeloyl-ACP methyl ester carboxylesterase
MTAPFPTENMKNSGPHYVTVKQGQMEYYRFGQGSPIIFIPGYLTDISSWDRTFLSTLAEKHQLIILNNRQVGGSQIHSTHYESQDLANDIYQLIAHLNLKKPTILGISMGGMIAQQLAVLHPENIGKIILINTIIAGKEGVHPSVEVENQLKNMPTSKLRRYIVAVKLFFPPSWRIRMAYALMADHFQPNYYSEVDPDTIRAQQKHLITTWLEDDAAAEKIKHITSPVLILNGEADIVIPPINSAILARAIPHAKLIRWKDGGHAMIYQYPVEMADEIDRFIN